MRKGIKSVLAWLAVAAFCGPAFAQAPLDLANYTGADRQALLIDAAKKERSLNFYTSLTSDDAAALTTPFEREFGVKVIPWRASNEDVLQRAVTEARGGRFDFDVAETSTISLEAMKREGLLKAVQSPAFADLMPQALAARDYIASRLQVITAAYNTSLVRQDALPKSYADLLDPRWKGKLTVESGDSDWFSVIAETMGEERATKLFRDIVATNGVSLRKGHTLIANLVAAGEVPLSLTTYLYKVNQIKNAGAPVGVFQIDPIVAKSESVALSAKAQHPNAALLFIDYVLGEGQKILAQREFFPTNVKAGRSLDGMKLAFVNPGKMLDEGDRWDKVFNDIFARRAR